MRNNKGLNFNNAIGVDKSTGSLIYKTSGYVKKGRKDTNNYTQDELNIMGQMVLEGVQSYRTAVGRLLNESEKGTTILNEGTFQLLWRVRQEKGTIGVKHWMNHVKPLKYYLETSSSNLFKEINQESV
tara:strand:- start:62 stop:445 length:384 start_codon:yes stop_codon:yes gene_type:complete